MTNRHLLRLLGFAGLSLLGVVGIASAEVRHITLEEAIHLALGQNRALKIARLKVEGNHCKRKPPSSKQNMRMRICAKAKRMFITATR